jgi:CRP-like cAMP-binding protein
MEAAMDGPMKPEEPGELDALALKFRSLGLGSEADLQTVSSLVKIRKVVRQGGDIADMRRPARQLTVLLVGVACLHKRLEDGSRRIYSFQHSGDFCDIHRWVRPEIDRTATVTALTDCSIGAIRYDDMERVLSQRPHLGLAFWRASMLEASIFREGLVNMSRRAALPRIASIICEQLARLEAIGIKRDAIPLTQVHLADAGGLSVGHVNRVVRDLRRLGALSKKTRTIEVASRHRLAELAGFDGRYLNMRSLLSDWQIDIEVGA